MRPRTPCGEPLSECPLQVLEDRFREYNDRHATRDESGVKLGAVYSWLTRYPRGRAAAPRVFRPRQTKLIHLMAQRPLFSILHCRSHAMQEKAKTVYWQLLC